jgi:hypothetical protein
MKMVVLYDKSGRIVAVNIPKGEGGNSVGPLVEPGSGGTHYPTPVPQTSGGLEQMVGVFDMPDELTMLDAVELTCMMENVKVDHEAKKLVIARSSN